MVQVIGINPDGLNEVEKNGFTILTKLSEDSLNDLKEILSLGVPSHIGPQTLREFLELCERVGLRLTNAGIVEFKDDHELGNTGDLKGVIGPQTAEVFYQTLLVLQDRGQFSFPFKKLPSADWTSGARRFGSNRNGGKRAHAGCDLYFPAGTPIHAVADGIVTAGPYPFYAKTFAIEVDHGAFLARYGEVQKSGAVGEGTKVGRGQVIAKVGHLVGISVASDMLHLELYDKSARGSLTVSGAGSKKRGDGVTFQRRQDLIDPTPFLNEWRDRLP